MDLKEKRNNERMEQVERRKDEIISAALSLFVEKGIDSTSINDIAAKAEVGPATVYRHFENKPQIVIVAAIKFWQSEISSLMPRILPESSNTCKGIDKIRNILNSYVILYQEYPEFIRFLDEFDNYVVKEKIDAEALRIYEQNILDLRGILVKALQEGKQDGTIKQEVEEYIFYATVTHAVLSLSEKLVLRGNILKSDNEIEAIAQLNLIIEMAVKYIST
ncbi:TetR/AcrR family transcriptional regulator [Inconstantimicrobium mannanitabidum]|uniref:Uncharacterized protein n=1 Tax=Inconstantimicrobium mannanitabidum TaxID=1604901 RepID=A0ACB5R817_9CLOT|nr:TetR/AcrR family transcriptional regulator [Clostridium sp. TW13]GKX65333.1 hypothetical protein rsdtw13_05910 [Clostridium sp. TW13]